MTDKVRTTLWFEKDGLAAAEFYTGLLAESEIEGTMGRAAGGAPLLVNFRLQGVPYQILNGGEMYRLSPAVSIAVLTEDQRETDRLWAALLQGGGAEHRCGWLADRFGLSWQIVPRTLPDFLGGADHEGAQRATEAMMGMTKLNIGVIEAAYRGDSS